jgi:transcriptional adapter 2-alpha
MGYMKGRNEFETEYDNDAEVIIRDITFDDDDEKEERDLKLKALEIYNSKLDERTRRRNFIVENGLLDYKKLQQQDRRRNKEDRDMYNNLRVFLQIMTKEEHEQFLAGVAAERNLRRRIQQLQHWRAHGIRTLTEGELFDIESQRRENSLRRAKDSSSYMYYPDKQRSSRLNRYQAREREENVTARLEKIRSRPRKPGQPLDLDGVVGVEMLSQQERVLCSNVRILPKQYLLIKDTLLAEHAKTGYLKKGTARSLVKIDVNKTARIFEFFEQCGWINRPNTPHTQSNTIFSTHQHQDLHSSQMSFSTNLQINNTSHNPLSLNSSLRQS